MKEENRKESDQSTTVLNPLSPYIDKYVFEQSRDLPAFNKTVVALATVAGASHGLLALAQATWVSYASFDLLFISFVLLQLWNERNLSHVTRVPKESSTQP
jgi:hypothetical protein